MLCRVKEEEATTREANHSGGEVEDEGASLFVAGSGEHSAHWKSSRPQSMPGSRGLCAIIAIEENEVRACEHPQLARP